MIHGLEDKNRKELVDIIKIQISEYRKLRSTLEDTEDKLESLQSIGHEETISTEALRKVLKSYDAYVVKNKGFNTMTLENYIKFQMQEYQVKIDELLSIDEPEVYPQLEK